MPKHGKRQSAKGKNKPNPKKTGSAAINTASPASQDTKEAAKPTESKDSVTSAVVKQVGLFLLGLIASKGYDYLLKVEADPVCIPIFFAFIIIVMVIYFFIEEKKVKECSKNKLDLALLREKHEELTKTNNSIKTELDSAKKDKENLEKFKDPAGLWAATKLPSIGAFYMMQAEYKRLVEQMPKIQKELEGAKTKVSQLENELEDEQTQHETKQDEIRRYCLAMNCADEAIMYFSRAVKNPSGEHFHDDIKRSLLLILQFFSTLAEKDDRNIPRCGIIVKHPDDSNSFIPLLVYDIGWKDYVSYRVFDTDDFSAKMLANFDANAKIAGPKDLLTLYHGDAEAKDSTVKKQPGQKFKSILGNIVYTCNGMNINAHGVINIDCNVLDGLDYEFFTSYETRIIQSPMFRLLSVILDMLEHDQVKIASIHPGALQKQAAVAKEGNV